MTTDNIKRQENLFYGLVWAIAITLYVLHVMDEHALHDMPLFGPAAVLRLILVMLPFFIIFLLNNGVLLPRLYFRKHLGTYCIAAGLLVALAMCYRTSLLYPEAPYPPMYRPGEMPGPPVPFDRMNPPLRHLIPMPLINYFVYLVLLIGGNIAVALTTRQFKFGMERDRLQAADMENRLDQLKAQINPHFYMNMLNNIHGLIDVDPQRAQDLVFDMSRLMRYMLYDSSQPRISLAKEVGFLEDYLRIMRQRYPGNKVNITSTFPSPEQMNHIKLPPLLFLVFIENAFKHGISYRQESYVAITLTVQDGEISFSCINTCHPHDEHNKGVPHGIGLHNVRQRLKLIYGDNAHLRISETEETYIVNLSIPADETENSDN